MTTTFLDACTNPSYSTGADSDWPCVVCRGATQRRFNVHGYWIRQCADCSQQRAEIIPAAQHVEQVYGDDYFSGGDAGYADYLSEAELLQNRGRNYARLLAQHVGDPGDILDVGAAAGFILQGFLDCGWQGAGLEPNAHMAAYAREQNGVDVQTGTLETFSAPRQFDLISMIQVVGHFIDLRQAFENACEATRDGGFWLIECWNRDSWTARLLGRHWHEYSPPSVLHWFTPQSLKRLARDYGLHEVAHGRPRKSLSAGHARSLLCYKLGNGWLGRAACAPLRLVNADRQIPYPAEDLFWMLLKKE